MIHFDIKLLGTIIILDSFCRLLFIAHSTSSMSRMSISRESTTVMRRITWFNGCLIMLILNISLMIFAGSPSYIFSKEIPYGDILDCMVIRYKWTDFIGWGIKRGPDGCTMYNVPGDQQIAVKIIVMDEESKRKEYAFSAKRPQVISKKVQTHIYDMPGGAKTEHERNKNSRSGIY